MADARAATKTKPLRLVFMGTPDFAATILTALIEAGYPILAAYTQPPRPAGRGHRLQASPVAMLADRHAIPVRAPTNLKEPRTQADFAVLEADAAVVAAYGLILPRPVLEAPRLGCLNVHASLLPRWRGAAPIQHAILAGDRETGITIMQMDAGLDTGPILLQEAVPIGPETTAGRLGEELASLGARLITTALDRIAEGRLKPQPQPEIGVTYAHKLDRKAGGLDWRQPAAALARQVRAFDPWPGTYFELGGERIRVLAAAAESEAARSPPGTILDQRLLIACGEGALRLLKLQRPGRAALDAPDFLRGFAIAPGSVLPCPVTS